MAEGYEDYKTAVIRCMQLVNRFKGGFLIYKYSTTHCGKPIYCALNKEVIQAIKFQEAKILVAHI